MKNFKILALIFGMLALLTACGSSTPTALSILGKNGGSASQPQLNSIIPSSTFNTTLVQGFNSNSPYWVFMGGFSSTGGQYIAPADGIVTDISSANLNGVTVTAVTLIHSGTLATRVFGMQVVDVHVHDIVAAGQEIGLYVTSGQVAFQVLVDGAAVCPLSFMSSAFRNALFSYSSTLCQ